MSQRKLSETIFLKGQTLLDLLNNQKPELKCNALKVFPSERANGVQETRIVKDLQT